jgi:hypothetical protein
MNKYKIKVTVSHGEDGYIYNTESFIKETVASSERKAINNIRWRLLGNKHKNDFVDHQPYTDRYYEIYDFSVVEVL